MAIDLKVDAATVTRLRDVRVPGASLIVCDVDEVVLEFVTPLRRFLATKRLALAAEGFRLHGNVRTGSGEIVPDNAVDSLVDEFFARQQDWQTPVAGCVVGLARLAETASVVLLTAMRHGHFDVRASLLASLEISWPLVTTEGSKGAALAELAHDGSIVFVDDLPFNHQDVRRHVPHACCIQFMADDIFSAQLPPLPAGVKKAADWPEIVESALEAVDAQVC